MEPSITIVDQIYEVNESLVVGATVSVRDSGRRGRIIVGDNTELPWKVEFDDGFQPKCDWFKSSNLIGSSEEAKAVPPELMKAERAGTRSMAENDAGRFLIQAQLAEHEAEDAQRTRQLKDTMRDNCMLKAQVSRESQKIAGVKLELDSLRAALQQRENECSLAEERRSKLARETQALCDRHVQDLQVLHEEIEERDEVISRLVRRAETRNAVMAEEMTVLREQLESVSRCARQSTAQLRSVQRGQLIKEATVAAAGAGGFSGNFSDEEVDDLEIGLHKAVTLDNIGLGSFTTCTAFDKRLSEGAQIVSRRADMRFAVFSVWIFCHLVYMASIFRSGIAN
eukprot:TRINITY_DN69199_c0_g1_i1.p1 TRINITY_DN69199_c0_g1~~TRINITY_DN69199_c0_g1_i1.p1  ORF type:complete len:340 (+),score=63.38 TRINITY_DN69199_c0_g1_i1:92-1111(+)